jgi:endonuclease/exonuclease/phosphatase (EEP) superfamily protein YafD
LQEIYPPLDCCGSCRLSDRRTGLSLEKESREPARSTGWRLGSRSPEGTRPDTDIRHIDYVLFAGALTPVGVYAIQESGGSDHLPLLASFSLEGE